LFFSVFIAFLRKKIIYGSVEAVCSLKLVKRVFKMGLINFIKDNSLKLSNDGFFCRYHSLPLSCSKQEIKMGAQLTVRESQVAIFINEGQLADVFEPGRYELTTENLPILTKLKSWKYGFNSPFKAEVYFINTRLFTEQTWGTQSPLPMLDPISAQLSWSKGNICLQSVRPGKILKRRVRNKGYHGNSGFDQDFKVIYYDVP